MIRRLTPADAAVWKAFRIEMLTASPRAFGASLADSKARSVEAFASWLTTAHIFGIEDPDLVASAAWYVENNPMTAHRAKLISVYVRPSHRGQGFVERLIEAVVSDAKAAGKLQVELDVAADNAAAVRVYERNGFQIAGRIPNALKHGDVFTDDIIMIRVLV
ncbi:MAG: GNAT family N-acetyltransferase [Deltaproteobacteria bacterium]